MTEDFEFKWFNTPRHPKVKAATEDEKKAQQARAKKYGISPKAKGNVTKPSKYSDVPDDKFADGTNYAYPLFPQVRAVNAITRFNSTANKAAMGYNDEEWAKMGRKIAEANGGADKGYSYDGEKKQVITPGTAPKEG